MNYPIKMKSTTTSMVVKFDSEHAGMIVEPGYSEMNKGFYSTWWASSKNTTRWVPHKISDFEIGRTYITNDGKGVATILVDDLESSCPILARIMHPDFVNEVSLQYNLNGEWVGGDRYNLNPHILTYVPRGSTILVRNTINERWVTGKFVELRMGKDCCKIAAFVCPTNDLEFSTDGSVKEFNLFS